MKISIETPVFKGVRLQRCIDSVLYQSSPDWEFWLLWDGGDEESRMILERLERRKLPNVHIYFAENRGIARARRFLSEHSRGEYILPLDDDDALPQNAVERFLSVAAEKPWAAVIRGQRKIIDDEGKVLDTPAWFPFEPRHFQHGMVTDLMNHTQPYLMSRWAYERTSGWEGFEDFGFAGEDCDIYLKLEEAGTIELQDETLYYYRVHDRRQSLVLTNEGAFEMWRRLADKTIARVGLPLKRVTETPPYSYEPLARPALELANVDFLIVRGEGPASAERCSEALRGAGVAADAVHQVERPTSANLNRAWRRSSRPLLCVIDADVTVDRGRLESLLRLMQESGADLAAPKLVTPGDAIRWANPSFGEGWRPLSGGSGAKDQGQHDRVSSAAWLSERFMIARREVLNAVGGFDEGFEDDRVAMVDLCLRARQRQFRCMFLGTVGFTVTSADPGPVNTGVLDRLRRKWAVYPELFARAEGRAGAAP